MILLPEQGIALNMVNVHDNSASQCLVTGSRLKHIKRYGCPTLHAAGSDPIICINKSSQKVVALTAMKPIALAVEVEPMSYLGGTPTKTTVVHIATGERESRVTAH